MNKNSKSGDIINPIAVFKDVDEPFSNNIKTAFSIAENRTQALKKQRNIFVREQSQLRRPNGQALV